MFLPTKKVKQTSRHLGMLRIIRLKKTRHLLKVVKDIAKEKSVFTQKEVDGKTKWILPAVFQEHEVDECVIPFACHIPFQPVPCLACHHQNCTQKPKTTKDWCICENCAHSYQKFNPTDYTMPNLSGCHKKCPGSWQKSKRWNIWQAT